MTASLAFWLIPPAAAADAVDAYVEAHAAPPTTTDGALGHDPLTARYADDVTLGLAMTEQNRAALATHGFVADARWAEPSYVQAYAEVFARDLPVFVTLDSGFYALHRSWDTALARLETNALAPKLSDLLWSLRDAPPGKDPEAVADVDVVLTVALDLLGTMPTRQKHHLVFSGDDGPGPPGPSLATADPANQSRADAVYAAAIAQRPAPAPLFGGRAFAFDLLHPVGHYATSATLARYFQATVWLGLAAPPITGPEAVRGLAFAAELVGRLDRAQAWPTWRALDDVARAAVGAANGASPADIAALRVEVGLDDPAAIATALTSGRYGTEPVRTAGAALDPAQSKGAPLLEFALLPRRATIDGAILSSVTSPTQRPDGTPLLRERPVPLDVVYALGNDAALPWLADGLRADDYLFALEAARGNIDALPPDAWDDSIYARWLSAIRALNSSAQPAGLPPTFGTDAWQHKLAHTQLAAWTELRHDNVMYAAMSDSGVIGCSFPAHYVEPYPEAWRHLGDLARAMDAATRPQDPATADHFAWTAGVMDHLAGIAQVEVTGDHLDLADAAFLSDLVDSVHTNGDYGGSVQYSGWYPRLLLDEADRYDPDVIVAPVHGAIRQDVDGALHHDVLHVGLGAPTLMVVSVATPDGPSTFVGPIQPYEEVWITDTILTDKDWAGRWEHTPATVDTPWWSESRDVVFSRLEVVRATQERRLEPEASRREPFVSRFEEETFFDAARRRRTHDPAVDLIARYRDSVSWTATTEEATRALERYVGQLRYCYAARLAASPRLHGTLTLAVDTKGTALAASVQGDDIGDAQLAACVVQKVEDWWPWWPGDHPQPFDVTFTFVPPW